MALIGENIVIIAFSIAILALLVNLTVPNQGITGLFTATPSGDANAQVTIFSDTSIIVSQNDVNLGSLRVNDSNASCGPNSAPAGNCNLGTTTQATGGRAILFQNNGNVDINVTAVSSDFFTSNTAVADGNVFGCHTSYTDTAASDAVYWAQFFLNCYFGTTPKIVGGLKYQDATDGVRLDFNVHVPPDEPPGLKQGTITL
ncbi:MAG: hypothetical protein Q7R47_02125, partial [Candidatus Diapherotrites archaeon]|nr:hypothetical protein [Candidatus Diapherotrites archaeon]